MSDEVPIVVSALRKEYGPLTAVHDISFEVRPGEIFALIGPNGAGKTTTLEILEGLRKRTSGAVSVLGVDPERARRHQRERVGFTFQEASLEPELTAAETLGYYRRMYSAPLEIDAALELVGLRDGAEKRIKHLSGGQARRLEIALAIVGDPDVIFLDEPTTGLDPAGRRRIWDAIASIRDAGKTILLTSHYMEEVHRLAKRLSIIAKGRIIASGDVEALREKYAPEAIVSFEIDGTGVDVAIPDDVLQGVRLRRDGPRASFLTEEPVAPVNRLTSWALEQGVALSHLSVQQPSLEDIYLDLTDDG